MMSAMPNFVGKELKDSSINPVMPPLEGAAVALTMLQQKMHTDLYQVAPEEFKNEVEKERKALLADKDKDKNKKPKLTAKVRSEKHKEMKETVARGAAKMSPDALANLPNTALDTLGVNR
jgi:hypothetical protein